MRRLGVAELKDNINEVLHEVERGETVAVVRNGRVVARLVPALRHRRSQREIDEIIQILTGSQPRLEHTGLLVYLLLMRLMT